MGKTYDMKTGTGLRLWNEVAERLPRTRTKILGPATEATQEQARFGKPILVAPRLGQGTFRALVTDAYNYKCAITSEKILPVLQAAHIRPHHKGGENEVRNGLLLRSDLHTLFDQHYLTIEPNNRTLVVSQRLHDDFDNGKYYHELNGTRLASPDNPLLVPSIDNLSYRYELFKEFEGSA